MIGTAVREPPSSIFLIKNLEVLFFQGCEGALSMRSPNPVHLELPLSCLHSLVRLELRNCNLQAVPKNIDGLHLLENLNLCENNFVCFPKSIIRLSKLKDILRIAQAFYLCHNFHHLLTVVGQMVVPHWKHYLIN